MNNEVEGVSVNSNDRDNIKHNKQGNKAKGNKSSKYGGKKRNNNNKRNYKTSEMTKPGRRDNYVIMNDKNVDNDVSWYTHIYSAASDVASIPFNVPLGISQNVVDKALTPYQTNTTANVFSATEHIPGIGIMSIIPVLGGAQDKTSAPNIAAQQLYNLIRRSNSGATNYDPTDVMLVVIAMDSAYMLYNYLLRAYRMVGVYNYMNRYMPEEIMRAIGYPVSIIQNNMADYRAMLNLFAYRLASINIPDQFDFIKRHSWLMSNVYKDDDTDKASMYGFALAGIYVYTEGENEEPAYLKYTPMRSRIKSATSIADIKAIIDSVMNPLLGSQDVGTISGDIAKAFGDNGMIAIAPVEEYAALEPVYSEEVLTQIQNANIINPSYYTPLTSSFDIKVNYTNLKTGPYLVQTPQLTSKEMFGVGAGAYLLPHLNFYKSNPTSDDVMVATRLQCIVENAVQNGSVVNIESSGTEIALGMEIWSKGNFLIDEYGGPIPDPEISNLGMIGTENSLGMNVDAACQISVSQLGLLLSLDAFNYHPLVYVGGILEVTTNKYTMLFFPPLGDLDNFKVFSKAALRDIHNVAVMSEFAVRDYKTHMTR